MNDDTENKKDNEGTEIKNLGTTETPNPGYLDDLRKSGERIDVESPIEEHRGETYSDPEKPGVKVTPITQKRDVLRIDPTTGMKLESNGVNCFVTYPDGTKQEVPVEVSDKLIKNGVDSVDFMAVEGVRKTTELEERVWKSRIKAKAMAAVLAVAIILPIPFIAKSCSNSNDYVSGDSISSISTTVTDYVPDAPIPPISTTGSDYVLEDPTPSVSTPVDENVPNPNPDGDKVVDDEKHEVSEDTLAIIYSSSYSDIVDVLQPGMIIREAQDAYEAVDYDVELLGGDLCTYETIRQEVVYPGSEFVEKVNDFKEKYGDIEFDSVTFQQMVGEAMPLLIQQGVWIDTTTGLVDKHVETTQQCIDKGIRGEDYVAEKSVTEAQAQELRNERARVNSVVTSLQDVQDLVQGFQNGNTISTVMSNGDILVTNGTTSVLYQHNQNVNENVDSNGVRK